jgi:acetyl esterase/lipase
MKSKRYIFFDSVKKIAFGFIHRLLLLFFMPILLSCATNSTSKVESETVNGNINDHLTANHQVRDIVNHSAFKSFGDLILPWDDNANYYNTRLTNIGSLMPYHSNVRTDVVLKALNHLIDEANNGKIIFYDFYTQQQKKQDPGRRNTGLFFYRGNPNAPFAIVCPGGGFSYVGSLHEGFPLALEISKKGLNAFVIRYRIGSEQKATEDLAAAVNYIFKNAATLGIGTYNYSLWGGSAGARMVGNIALSGVTNYGGDNHPKPSTVVIAYTGHSTYSNSFPPTFITVSADDGIANISTVERRVENLRKAGVEVEYHQYKNAGHGFGLGTGTDAEGWLDLAVQFWEKQITHQKI